MIFRTIKAEHPNYTVVVVGGGDYTGHTVHVMKPVHASFVVNNFYFIRFQRTAWEHSVESPVER